ncbi:carboxylesterase family protein [Stagonosporopsis vannaccii]|nr:carboxylesterase family protein [Stagonosporopsis vannaccii]
MLPLLPLLLCAVPAYALTTQLNASLPLVDLGYTIHRASFNDSGNYFNFSNIRYAAPPLGSLRFAAPVPPQDQSRAVDDGSLARICPQAYPLGAFVNNIYNSYYSQTGRTALDGFQNATTGFNYPRNTPQDPRATEDCLFLDVMVPRAVFEGRRKGKKRGAAVMVWIHGGGFGAGTKYDVPSAGLLARSQTGGEEGVVFVAINYRLGAFGWLSGPSFAAHGTPNAGFYDQRLALRWVQANIHRFGGDPARVTVFGESAGGGSIAFQLTAFGGEKGRAPFQRAIMQSPGFTPPTGKFEQEDNFQKFLGLLNVSSLAEAREMDTQALQVANEFQIRTSRAGSWTYGPVVDGTFVPELPGLSLLHGRFDRSVDVLVGHNGNEGFGFPSLQNTTAFDDYISLSFPNAPPAAHKHITTVLYPPVLPSTEDLATDYNPSTSTSQTVTGYVDPQGRQALLTSETVINCLVSHINRAFSGRSYSYVFSVPPALHGQELYYVFYNGQATDVFYRPVNVGLAGRVQDYWLSFAREGKPGAAEGGEAWETWGQEKRVMGFSLDGAEMRGDVSDNERCRWWQLGLYL